MPAVARTLSDLSYERQGRNELIEALARLKPGEMLIYYVGDLANARDSSPKLHEVASFAYELSRDRIEHRGRREIKRKGRLHLTQQRLGTGKYAYIATGQDTTIIEIK